MDVSSYRFTALSAALSIAVLGLVWYWLFGRGTKGGNKSGGIMGLNPFVSH